MEMVTGIEAPPTTRTQTIGGDPWLSFKYDIEHGVAHGYKDHDGPQVGFDLGRRLLEEHDAAKAITENYDPKNWKRLCAAVKALENESGQGS